MKRNYLVQALMLCTVLGFQAGAAAQVVVLVEDFEFAVSDEAAEAGVVDKTDPANSPAFYISGDGNDASPQEPGGNFSIGTDAVFCLQACVPCSVIGFRRYLPASKFPDTCGTHHYLPLEYAYGDPSAPGPEPADKPLEALTVLCDAYGDGSFADGPLDTHFHVNLVDCEGEIFQFVNFKEPALWFDDWTLNVVMGDDVIRISPESFIKVPNGDRLLTEIAAIEVFIQDCDNPPTTAGKWYIDYLRVIEPPPPIPFDGNGDGVVDGEDYALMSDCLLGPQVEVGAQCSPFDDDQDLDVDLRDVAGLFAQFGAGR